MNIVPIAFAFDNNLVMPACVCISSLMMNAEADTFYDIYILHSAQKGIDKSGLDRIPEYYHNCRVNYREIGNDFDGAFEIRGITTPAYYRLLIPEVIPEYDKIIYSDVDVIFRTDLSEVYSEDLLDYYIGATYDLGLCLSHDGYKYLSSVNGLEVGEYIQSGFIILNSAKLREMSMPTVFKQFASKKLRYQDQDILNISCRGHIKIIPYMYNMTDQLFYYLEKEPDSITGKYDNSDLRKAKTCGTLHYNGYKPWKSYCANFDIWWEYYRRSPFFDEKYYFDFFYSRIDEYDRLSLLKRIKILLRYFVYGKK